VRARVTLWRSPTSLKWHPGPTHKLELESKEDWTGRIGRSCDRPDSFSVCLAMGDVELLRFQRELNASGAAYW